MAPYVRCLLPAVASQADPVLVTEFVPNTAAAQFRLIFTGFPLTIRRSLTEGNQRPVSVTFNPHSNRYRF